MTRENTNALTGSSAISAQSDAATERSRRPNPRGHAGTPATSASLDMPMQNAERRAERQRKPGIDDLQAAAGRSR